MQASSGLWNRKKYFRHLPYGAKTSVPDTAGTRTRTQTRYRTVQLCYVYALDSPTPEKSNYFTAHSPPPRGVMDLFLDLAHTLVNRTLAAILASMSSNFRVQSTDTFIFSLAQKFRPALKKCARHFAHPLSN